MDTNELMKEALAYHAEGGPGKIEIRPTKPDATQYDLSLAYSPGVAAPCLAIADDPAKAYDYTIKGNLVAVITNGTAVLGLGDIGPLAAKPVMEGKCMLFKHFSGINAFDIEIDTIDPEEFIAAVKRIAPTFGGINLEDIKAPECFEIERRLVEELDIPVMHDDQHGTAIIASAALINAMHLSGKRIDEAQIVVNGAGAAAIACARMFLALGARRDQITMCDSRGVVTTRRTDLNGGGIRVNFLVNYGWEWDLSGAGTGPVQSRLRSHGISRIDLVVRWGGMRRLSGFLPVQSVYADFYVVDRLWPDFQPQDWFDALTWYDRQDVTLGG